MPLSLSDSEKSVVPTPEEMIQGLSIVIVTMDQLIYDMNPLIYTLAEENAKSTHKLPKARVYEHTNNGAKSTDYVYLICRGETWKWVWTNTINPLFQVKVMTTWNESKMLDKFAKLFTSTPQKAIMIETFPDNDNKAADINRTAMTVTVRVTIAKN